MTYNSLEFIVLAALFFAFWPFFAPRSKTRWIFLTIFSFIFYGWWDWRYLALLIYSGLVDYWAALAIVKWPHRKRLWMGLSIFGNIGSLALFKYLGFFTRVAASLSAALEGPRLPVIDLILPVGISFYTFQSLSYTIDVYRGTLKPTHNVWHFFAYLSVFTQLIAGPIVRAADLLPQMESWQKPKADQVWDGLRLVATGYFKKCFVADNIAVAVAAAFSAKTPNASAMYWWGALALFAMQIYTDFSGYTDIARGLSKWMGYHLPINFRHPLSAATSLTDFWNRWHITLSTWFRDYVYMPLGGGFRRWSWLTYRNTLITMTLIGFWHGAAWNFVIFGFLHGVFLCIERAYNWPKRLRRLPGGNYMVTFLVFCLFLFIGVWFGARSFSQGIAIWAVLFDPAAYSLRPMLELGKIPLTVGAIAIMLELITVYGVSDRARESGWYRALEPSLIAVFIAASIFLRGPGSAFVYFQF